MSGRIIATLGLLFIVGLAAIVWFFTSLGQIVDDLFQGDPVNLHGIRLGVLGLVIGAVILGFRAVDCYMERKCPRKRKRQSAPSK